jgi:hypothetical protein
MTGQAAAKFDGKNSKFDRQITCFERASTATELEKREVSCIRERFYNSSL